MAKLRDFAEVVMGQSPPGETVTNLPSGLPLLNGPTEFGGYHPFAVQYTNDGRKRAREGDLLFCVRGSTTGRMNWADQTYAIGRGVAAIRHKTQIECQPFIRAAIEAELPKLLAAATGSTFPNVSRDQLLDIEVPDIEESVQLTLSRVLAGFDLKIELNRRMNQTLEAMARALFKSWFVDFDPVVAKSEGRPTGLPPDLDALFPSEFEDSTMGPVPKGWCVCTIGDLADVVGGSTPSTSQPEFWDGTHCWATPRDLSRLSNPVLLTTERRITDKGVACIGSGLLPVGTVLMSSRAPIGYFAVALVPVAINQGFIAMKPKDGIPNLYLLNWVQSNQDVILSRANGSTFLEISKSSFRPIEAVRPPQPLLDEFYRLAAPWFEKLVSNERETRALTVTRDDLLPRLLSGEVEVVDAQEVAHA